MKTILVTGANRGIGLEFIKKLTKQKSLEHIFAGCRLPEDAKDLKFINEKDKQVHVLKLDVANDESIRNAAKQLAAIVGSTGLNVLVNNAGILLHGQEFGHATRQAMIETYHINTVGALMCVQTFHDLLLKAATAGVNQPIGASWALVFNVSTDAASMGGYAAPPWVGLAYRCSKAALNMAMKSMSVDLKNENIVTMAVHPGFVATDMNEGGVMTTGDSVTAMIKLIETANESSNGRFVNWLGEDYAW